jgi:hypothetical protein
MRKSLISAAAITTFAALVLSAPASALENYGPKQVGNQCFTATTNWGRDQTFGSWGACPAPASVSSTPAQQRIRHRHR